MRLLKKHFPSEHEPHLLNLDLSLLLTWFVLQQIIDLNGKIRRSVPVLVKYETISRPW